MSVLLVFVRFHSGLEVQYRGSFSFERCLWTSPQLPLAPEISLWTFFPASSQINNPPSWRRARFCFETISPDGPLKHARLIKKRGETTRTVQLSSERKCSTSGAREENVDSLNGPLCQPSNAIVLPCNTHTYKSHFNLHTPPAAFLHSFVHSFTLPFQTADALYGERKDSQYPHPLFLQSAVHSVRQTLHVQPPKHSTCHSSLTGCWKQLCILIFSAPIH